MMSTRIAVLLLALLPLSGAAAVVATPATIDSVVNTVRPGETITLAPGSYPPFKVRDRHWSPAITVEANGAELRQVRFDNVSGVNWHGGTFDGGDTVLHGFAIIIGDHVNVDGGTFRHHALVGLLLGQVTDARLTNNVFTDSGSDGIDIAMSQRVIIDHNRCTDFKPNPGAHADCIQLWSKPNFPPVADIVVSNNVAIGDMQGFTGFDGPYDHITIENNVAKVAAWHGVALFDCTHCIVRHNRVESLPNPKYPTMRAWIKTLRGTDVIECDNRAKDYPDDAGRKKCKPDK